MALGALGLRLGTGTWKRAGGTIFEQDTGKEKDIWRFFLILSSGTRSDMGSCRMETGDMDRGTNAGGWMFKCEMQDTLATTHTSNMRHKSWTGRNIMH